MYHGTKFGGQIGHSTEELEQFLVLEVIDL